MNSPRSMVAALLVAVCGAGVSATAQQTTRPQTGHASMSQQQSSVGFCAASKLYGADVYNSADDKVGEIEDFIVDRGTGKVISVVLDSTRRASDGKKHSVPMSAFNFSNIDKRIVLNLDNAALTAMPVYEDKSWAGLRTHRYTARRTDTTPTTFADQMAYQAAMEDTDPYTEWFKNTPKTTTIRGKVVSVDRRWETDSGEQTVVTLRTDDGQTRVVSLGPSWYTFGANAPVRDQPYSVEVVELPNARGDVMYVATSVDANGQKRVIRTNRGVFPWADEQQAAAMTNAANWSDRFVLLRKLKGDQILARGEKCGKLHDVVIETNAGRAAFLSIDPDKNFLGMGDTKRLVPWSVVAVAIDGQISIDATKDMVLKAPPTPDDARSLNAGAYREAYTAYAVPVPSYRSDMPGNR